MNQLTKGQKRRLMYIENKDGLVDGKQARVGWVSFSKTGLSVYYREKQFSRLKGGGFNANYYCNETGEEFWISGVKKHGSNVHWAEPVTVHIDEDAVDEYKKTTNS